MKNIFATLALLAISSTAFLGATTEAPKADAAKCPAGGCNKAVAATTAPSASTTEKANEPSQTVEETAPKVAAKA